MTKSKVRIAEPRDPGALLSYETTEQEEIAAEYFRREARDLEECCSTIRACFMQVSNKLGYDAQDLKKMGYDDRPWELFAAFLQECRPKKERKKKGSHNPEYDAELLKAGAAPDGKRTIAIADVAKKYRRFHDENSGAAERHLDRLQSKQKRLRASQERMAKLFQDWARKPK